MRGSAKMNRFILCVSMAIALGVTCMLMSAQDPPATPIERSDSSLMRHKLRSSQIVLEGIVTDDYHLVAQGARELKRISVAAEWSRTRDSTYEHYSSEFRRLCGKLEDLATQENRDGIAFTYFQAMTACINCHDLVRASNRLPRREDVKLIPAEWPERNIEKRVEPR